MGYQLIIPDVETVKRFNAFWGGQVEEKDWTMSIFRGEDPIDLRDLIPESTFEELIFSFGHMQK